MPVSSVPGCDLRLPGWLRAGQPHAEGATYPLVELLSGPLRHLYVGIGAQVLALAAQVFPEGQEAGGLARLAGGVEDEVLSAIDQRADLGEVNSPQDGRRY